MNPLPGLGMGIGMGIGTGIAAGVVALALAGCGSSAATSVSPSQTPSQGPTPTTPAPTTPAPGTAQASATITVNPPPTSVPLSSGAKSATCVNGWIQPAPGSDFYKQATSALEQSEGGTGYVVKSVRYFAGPLATGGIGAIYYLDVNDPRLTSRVLLVSGAGPASVALAKPGTTGWKPADWTAPGGRPTTVSLSPSVAGCLDGT